MTQAMIERRRELDAPVVHEDVVQMVDAQIATVGDTSDDPKERPAMEMEAPPEFGEFVGFTYVTVQGRPKLSEHSIRACSARLSMLECRR